MIKLSVAIDEVKRELRRPSESNPMFRLKSVKIIAKVLFRESDSVEGGIGVNVFKLGSTTKEESETLHEIAIELEPVDGLPFLGELATTSIGYQESVNCIVYSRHIGGLAVALHNIQKVQGKVFLAPEQNISQTTPPRAQPSPSTPTLQEDSPPRFKLKA